MMAGLPLVISSYRRVPAVPSTGYGAAEGFGFAPFLACQQGALRPVDFGCDSDSGFSPHQSLISRPATGRIYAFDAADKRSLRRYFSGAK